MKLTSQQNLALRHKDGPILVLAGPGAGKTTMLLERIKFLSGKVDPKHILTITFSKSQALDMKDRYNSSDANFMTIHAFCYLIIRNYLKQNNRNLRLLESDDLYNKYDLIGKISKEDLSEFFRLTSYMKNAMIDDTYLGDTKVKNCLQIYRAYENFKIRNYYIDFDDMQVMALKLIENDPRLLNSIRKKYRYIQVDEGQDTSLIQFKIIEKIAAPLNNLMIVADDDQSIYSFRAADVSYLLNLKSKYSNLKIIEMTENHRSSNNIVNLSKAFIDINKNRYLKDLFTKNDFQGIISIKSLRSVRDQYKFIIDNIKKGEKNAILFRNNIQAVNIISFLMEDDIDFSVNISSLDFFESKIIDDLFNIIEFSDDFDWLDLFCEIYYKIGTFLKKKEVDRLSFKAINKNVFEALYEMDLEDYKIETLIQKEKQLKHIRKLSLDKKISYIYKYMDYKSYISNFSKKYREEVVNKDLFVESMINFTKNLKTIEDFYNKKDKLEKKLSSSNSDLILSSIHKSKGLEYDNVFVINMVKNEFPIIVDNEYIEKKIEEERRVMYVAMTRAKKNLHILSIKKRGSEKLSPSIFFTQIKDLL